VITQILPQSKKGRSLKRTPESVQTAQLSRMEEKSRFSRL